MCRTCAEPVQNTCDSHSGSHSCGCHCDSHSDSHSGSHSGSHSDSHRVCNHPLHWQSLAAPPTAVRPPAPRAARPPAAAPCQPACTAACRPAWACAAPGGRRQAPPGAAALPGTVGGQKRGICQQTIPQAAGRRIRQAYQAGISGRHIRQAYQAAGTHIRLPFFARRGA